MDFSAYYTAGEAVNEGLSPYKNLITHSPPIWDGRAAYEHSRFLYPPLAANFFQVIAKMPYYYAKYLWMVLGLVCLGGAMYISFRAVMPQAGLEAAGLCGIFICLFYPLLTILERGQVDCLTLFLITCATGLIATKRSRFWAGVLFSLATLLKLHLLVIIAFLIIRRQWKVISGYIAGVLIMIILTVIFNGVGASLGYVRDELPRISKYGESKDKTLVVPAEIKTAKKRILNGLEEGYTIKDGRKYLFGYFYFSRFATLVRTPASFVVKWVGDALGFNVTITVISIFFFGAFFCIFFMWKMLSGYNPQGAGVAEEFIYWQIVFVMILLCGPLTWVMNTVWLLVPSVILVRQYFLLKNKTEALILCLGALGLLGAALPDYFGFGMLVAYGGPYIGYKYIISEILIFASLLGILRSHYITRVTGGPVEGKTGSA
jgi:hypothetical protein